MITEDATGLSAFGSRLGSGFLALIDGPGDVFLHEWVVYRGTIWGKLLQGGQRYFVAAVADGNGKVAPEPDELRAGHGAPLHQSPELCVGLSPQFDQARQVES